jgi:hypothetical protein
MAEDSGAFFDRVRLIDLLVQLESSGGGAPIATLVAGTGLRCKIRPNPGMPNPHGLSPAFDTGTASRQRNAFAPEFRTEKALENQCGATRQLLDRLTCIEID